MGKKIKAKRITFISAMVSLASFLYKLALGIMTSSLVLMIASISTFLVFVCKITFVRNVTMSRERKKKAYLKMAVSAFLYAAIFIAFVCLKLGGIDISNKNTFEGIYGTLFILFIIVMFILSVINLKGALEKTDLMVIGLKEMTFVSALSDFVIIEEFISRIILQYHNVPNMAEINSWFCLGAGLLMVIVSIIMFVRHHKYRA